MKTLLTSVVFASALFAQPSAPPAPRAAAPSDELNKNLPSWIRLSGEYRIRNEGQEGAAFKPSNDDNYLLSRLRLDLLLRPASWLKLFAQTQDSRVFWKNLKPYGPPYQNTFDLRIAYIEIGDSDKKNIGIRVGRQEINLGDQRLVGSTNWTNNARTFDAVRLTLRSGGYRLDAFASSVVVQVDGAPDHHLQGSNLHGLYGGIDKLVPGAAIEPYIFWRLIPRVKTELGKIANEDMKTAGFRWVGKVRGGLDYGTEIAAQTGFAGKASIGAWAGHWVTGYTLAAARWKPRMLIEYNYATGDKNPKDGSRGTFDQLYPAAHDKYGLADQVGWRNIKDLRTGIELTPRHKMTSAVVYHDYWLASARDGLYAASGALMVRKLDGSAGTHVGQELDVQGFYAFNKSTLFGAGIGHLFPGEFLKKASPGHSYTYPFVTLAFSF